MNKQHARSLLELGHRDEDNLDLAADTPGVLQHRQHHQSSSSMSSTPYNAAFSTTNQSSSHGRDSGLMVDVTPPRSPKIGHKNQDRRHSPKPLHRHKELKFERNLTAMSNRLSDRIEASLLIRKRSSESLRTASLESLIMSSCGMTKETLKDECSTDDSRDERTSNVPWVTRSPCIQEADETKNNSSSVSFVDTLYLDNDIPVHKDDGDTIDVGTWSDSSSRANDSMQERKSTGTSCEKSSESERTDILKGSTHERAFEKSLDNVMDKISDRSFDLSMHFDKNSFSDTGRDDESRSLKQTKAEKKRKSSSWYSVLSPTYKSRSEDYKKIFKEIPNDERLIVDYSCALQKDILVHGRMFISQNWVCFYANIFRWETVLTIPCKEICAITKEKTARVIPNAIQIATEKDKYFFTSFGTRDKTFMMLFRIWQNALMDQPMTPQEQWHWVHISYGEELGLTSSDDDYVPPPGLDYLRDRHITKEDGSIAGKDCPTDSSDQHVVQTESITNADDTDLVATDDAFEPSQDPIVNGDEPLTDFGDTTEESDDGEGLPSCRNPVKCPSEETGEIICTGHEHFSKTYMNEVFSIPVDKMFEYLFTDSPFFRHFAEVRKTYELVLPPWQEEPDADGNRQRTITYTLTLGASLGPKNSTATENQVCYKQSQPGMLYVIDTSTTMASVPYTESFYVEHRYCITRASYTKCRLKVTSDVRYRKTLWGIVKNIIEKNAAHGCSEYFHSLACELQAESEKLEQNHSGSHSVSKKKVRKRRRQIGSTSETPVQRPGADSKSKAKSVTPSSPSKSQLSKDEKIIKLNADTMIRIVCFVLVLLVMFNAVLFYKLWSLESYANTIYLPYLKNGLQNKDNYPQNQEEWAELLKQQQVLHESELERWREILSAAVILVDQVKLSLSQLQETLQHRHQSR
ncbi:protein Aster-B isoform X4 [Octopus sinensis]|uniref:Protein Aster-B isoform X4 n=1 Tax=Octopus sinensis TaxID=2607531 RepID=A0A6P7SCD5_9MOLL|nr:protein Aster-B isoform X4 [Octopus sinensis]